MGVGQKQVPKWVALVNGNRYKNLWVISWWFSFDPFPYILMPLIRRVAELLAIVQRHSSHAARESAEVCRPRICRLANLGIAGIALVTNAMFNTFGASSAEIFQALVFPMST